MAVLTREPAVKSNGSSINLEQMTMEVLRRLAEQVEDAGFPAELKRRNGYKEMPAMIGISVRHVHLCPAHIAILFGEGYDLHVYNELYQKGYYAAKEQVMVVGRKRCIEKIRVLGPPRSYSQVELAQTDAMYMGLKLPVATEGAEPGTQPITIVGPEGAVTLPGGAGGGAFIARRHIHLSEVTAQQLGVKAGSLLDLRIDGPRPTTLHGLLVRVKAGWRTEIHLDTDEANACGIRNGQMGALIIPA
ncbi:MAG: PduL/EutD family phosphate acyltransferase [Chloroflexota bacterium]